MVADGNGELTAGLGLLADLSVKGLGQRGTRAAMVVEPDLSVSWQVVDTLCAFEHTRVERVLAALQHMHSRPAGATATAVATAGAGPAAASDGDLAASAPPLPAATRPSAAAAVEVDLRPVTKETLDVVAEMSVAAEQQHFVAPNSYSVAEAHFDSALVPWGIWAGDTAVGFAMISTEPDAEESPWARYYLHRFMIAAEHQGKGYGRAAMLRIAEHVRALPDGTELFLSYEEEQAGGARSAEGFYTACGYAKTGRIVDDEVEMRIAL
eukprot:SAG22_NODE_1407_length_4489_cov_3.308884_3_plen_267_part_00